MNVFLTRRARQDLARIREYIAQDNPKAASGMAAALVAACEGLQQFPERGRRGPLSGTRELTTIPPYIITYRVREAGIEILSIWHAKRNRARG